MQEGEGAMADEKKASVFRFDGEPGERNAHTGSWRWLTEHSGLPLGLFDGLPYQSYSAECLPGDQFLLYSDGVTEAMNTAAELYGEARL